MTAVLDAPVIETGVPPIARGTIQENGINPWDVLMLCMHQQCVLDKQRTALHRATNRILTAPLETLRDLPLLSNPGRLQLPVKPWAATRPAGADGKFVKVGS